MTICPARGLRLTPLIRSTTGSSLQFFTWFRVFSLVQDQSVCLFAKNTTALSYLRNQGGTHSATECGGPGHSPPLRTPSNSPASPVHSGPHECSGGLSQSLFAGSRVGVDPLLSSLSGAPSSLAGHNRSFRDGSEPSASRLLFANVGSTVSGHGRYDAVLGRAPGLRLPSVRSAASCFGEGQAIEGVGAHPSGSVLAAKPWFPDPLELLVVIPFFLPQRKDLLKQPHFHRFLQNLPVLRLTANRISSDPHEASASLRKWLVNLPTADGLPPE